MKRQKTKAICLLFASGLFLAGCLEHRYFISIRPDRSVTIDYELRGDRVDLEDGNELAPDSALWSVERSIEEGEDQTTYILKGARSLRAVEDIGPALNWQKSVRDSIYFRPEIDITAKFVPFGKVLEFSALIPSRHFIEYFDDIWVYVPEECRALENEDELKNVPADEVKMLEMKFGLGIIQWNRARYERMFDRAWQICNSQDLLLPDENQTGLNIAKAGWVDDLHSYLNSLDVGEPQTANLYWWADVRHNFIYRFSNLIEAQNIDRVGQIGEAIEKNYAISKDLEDDKFVLELTMPGFIYAVNGLREDRPIRWEFTGKDFSNADISLGAKAFQFDFVQIFGVLILGALIGWVLNRRIKTRRAADSCG